MARWGPDLRGAEMRTIVAIVLLILPALAFGADAKTPKAKAGPLHDRALCEQRRIDAMNAQKAPVAHPGKVKPAGRVYEECMKRKGRQP